MNNISKYIANLAFLAGAAAKIVSKTPLCISERQHLFRTREELIMNFKMQLQNPAREFNDNFKADHTKICVKLFRMRNTRPLQTIYKSSILINEHKHLHKLPNLVLFVERTTTYSATARIKPMICWKVKLTVFMKYSLLFNMFFLATT